jgi:hypothetical protein
VVGLLDILASGDPLRPHLQTTENQLIQEEEKNKVEKKKKKKYCRKRPSSNTSWSIENRLSSSYTVTKKWRQNWERVYFLQYKRKSFHKYDLLPNLAMATISKRNETMLR